MPCPDELVLVPDECEMMGAWESVMTRDHDGHAGAVLMAFVLGAVSGAAVALLWAPTDGDEARRVLNEKAREGRGRATDAARMGREFVSQQRNNLATAIDEGREAYERARNKRKDSTEAPA